MCDSIYIYGSDIEPPIKIKQDIIHCTQITIWIHKLPHSHIFYEKLNIKFWWFNHKITMSVWDQIISWYYVSNAQRMRMKVIVVSLCVSVSVYVPALLSP